MFVFKNFFEQTYQIMLFEAKYDGQISQDTFQKTGYIQVPLTPAFGIVSKLTLTSISPILFSALMIGRPTIDGKMNAGKLLPAYPHLTN